MPEIEEVYTDLTNLGRGAAVELFNDGLNIVLANILDPNTEATAVRSLILTVKFTPTEERNAALVTVEIKSKLESPKGVGTYVSIGKEKGHPVATERIPHQPELPMANVSGIRKGVDANK